ncbi:MAG: biotin--[acetyl-CoA-carboxylase] ligase [Burkholderiaceae bacterium]
MIDTVVSLAGYVSLLHVAETDSTNSVLLAHPFADDARPALALWADHQRAGRGRRERSWSATAGSALMFSVALESRLAASEPPPVAFSLVCGLLVHRRLAERLSPGSAAALRVKWPNDLLLAGRKLAGILIETRRQRSLERIVVGIGVNLHADPSRPEGSACLADAGLSMSEAQCESLVGQLRDDLARALPCFREHGFGPWRDAWMQADAFAGRAVRLTDADRLLAQGLYRGLADDGAVLVESADGVLPYRVGDLSLRDADPARALP